MASLLDEAIKASNDDVAKMPKYLPLETAQKIQTVSSLTQKQLDKLPDYKVSTLDRMYKGAANAIGSAASNIAPSLQLYGEEVQLGLGGYFGAKEEFIERKKLNIVTLQRNIAADQRNRMQGISQETADSWGYRIGSGVTNLAMMAAGGVATGGAKALFGASVQTAIKVGSAASIASAIPLENMSEQSDRIKFDEQGNVDATNITPEWARKTAGGIALYNATMGILESKFGIFKTLSQWEKPIPFKNALLKNASVPVTTFLKTAINEGVTEELESLASAGIQFLEGNINLSELPQKIQDSWKDSIVAMLFGGATGTAVGINQAHNVKQGLTEMVQPVLQDPELTEKVVEAIYDSGTAEMTNFISRELELSSELNAKHGAIYDTMQGVIYDAINNVGAFEGVPEAEIAQYVSDTSKMFANQVVAEAHKRGVSIDGVLKASDIKFENGKIYMQAGKEIIAETPVVSEEVSAKIAGDNNSYNISTADGDYRITINTSKSGKQTYERIKTDSKGNVIGKEPIVYDLEKLKNKYGTDDINEIIKHEASTNGTYDSKNDTFDSNKSDVTFKEEKPKKLSDYKKDILNQKFDEGKIDTVKWKYNKKVINKPFKSVENEFTYANREFNKVINDIYNNPSIVENPEEFKYLEEVLLDGAIKSLPYNDKEEVTAPYYERFWNAVNAATEYLEAKKNNKLYQEKDQTETEAFKKWSDDAPLVTSEEALSYDFKTGNKVVVEGFHGTKRADRIGSIFRPDRATSGPMAFFSSNREVSEGYARNKADTSIAYEDTSYENYYKFNLNGQKIKLSEVWNKLTPEQRNSISEKAGHITYDENAENIIYDENVDYGSGNYQQYLKERKGNALHALIDEWLNSGNLYNEEERFAEVLKLAGLKETEFEYDNPYAENPNVYDVYLSFKNPLVTNNIPKKVINKLNKVAQEQPIPKESWGADMWDKNTRNPIEWAKKLQTDYSNNENSHVWTSIPDWVTDVLKSFGYDGIIDMGGKSGGEIHKVYIPFESTQIKSVENQGTFDENNPNIYYQLKNMPKQQKVYGGAFTPSTKAIELFKVADYSTLPHELAHFWLDNMWGYYRSGKASEAYSNNFKAVLDWLGVKEGQTYFTRGQQEKFADGYVKYLKNGYAPNGLIQGAFDDYEKWLEKLYNDANKLKVKLTPDAIEFFDSMTTGELPEYDVPETQAQIREQNIEQMNKDIETARKFVVEKQAEYNNFDGGNVITKDTVPVTTEGEKKQSKAYTNQASILGIAEELNYNKADIAEQNKLASEYVKNNLDEARQIVNGQKEAPKNILKNAIYNAYLKEMLAMGDNDAYIDALRNQSLELTRAGQEIASQRGAIENIFDSGYWIRRIENLKKSKLAAQKFGGVTGAETEQAVSKMNDFIKNKVDAVMHEFMDATAEEQKKIAEKLSKDIAAEFNTKPDTKLYQSMYEPSEVRTKTNAYNYIYRYINNALGIELTKQQKNKIIAKTMAIQKSIDTTRNRNGNPSALFFKNMSDMENYANSIQPSQPLTILTSLIGRGNMLASIKTPLLNFESNAINYITEFVIRRIALGTTNMAVDPQAIKDYLAYSKEVFKTSGYQVSSMPELDATQKMYGEQTSSYGEGVINKWGRLTEQIIFKYSLGYPDLWFKDRAFVDAANLLATKEAKGDTKKATELFKDICLIEPKSIKGQELRQIAINEALVATYQNDSALAKGTLAMRNIFNKVNVAGFKMGDAIEPFVKTPANVLAISIDYSAGGLVGLGKAAFNWNTIAHDLKNGTFSDTTRSAIKSVARNAIGILAAALISNMIDDDDYIPDYAMLSPKERELVKMKGGAFNSIKVGDKYISLDYFGPLGMALAGFLNARRSKSKVIGYMTGMGLQSGKTPVVSSMKELFENIDKYQKDVKDKSLGEAVNWDFTIDFLTSRFIPSIVTDIAKMTDEYERETNNNALKRLQSKIPWARELLPAQYNYGTGQPRETQNPVSQLFAGARFKNEVSTPVIREIDKLIKDGQAVTISKVTKTGKLSSLSDEKKNKAEQKFAKLYAKNVSELIKMPEYKNLSNEEKANNINKIRSMVVADLKEQYGLNKKEKKPRTKKLINKKNINLD